MSPRIYFATNTHLPVPSFRFSGRRLFLDENDKPLLSQNKTDFSLLNKKCKCSARRKCLLRFEGTLLEFTPNLKQRMFPKYTATRVKNKGGGTKKHAQYDVKFILSRQKKGNRFFTIFFWAGRKHIAFLHGTHFSPKAHLIRKQQVSNGLLFVPPKPKVRNHAFTIIPLLPLTHAAFTKGRSRREFYQIYFNISLNSCIFWQWIENKTC